MTGVQTCALPISEAMEEHATEPPTEPPTPTTTNENIDEDEGDNMTAEDLKRILEQDGITDEDKQKLTIYLRKKKNKRKRNLLREIREKFKF